MNTKYSQETIENYLLHRLSKEEETAFEEAMNSDEQVQEEVELMRHIVVAFKRKGEQDALDAIKRSSLSDIRNLIEEAEKRHGIGEKENGKQVASPGKSKFIIGITSIAAAIAILIYIGFRPEYSENQLFNEYYSAEIYETTPLRGEPDAEQERMTSALNHAIGLIEKQQMKLAIEELKPLASSGEFDYQEDAQWYLALAYLENNQRDDSKEILSGIIAEKGEYLEKAQELLDKLNEKKWF